MYSDFFINLYFKQIYNKYLRTRNNKIRSFYLLLIIVVLEITAVLLLIRYLTPVLEENYLLEERLVATAFFILILSWIMFMNFMGAIIKIVPEFYAKADLNYLLSTPIPIYYIFGFRFFAYLFKVSLIKFLIFIPVMIYMGITYSAGSIYFLLILPVTLSISIISAAAGVIIAIVGLRFLSVKLYNYVTGVGSFIINILLWFIFWRYLGGFAAQIGEYLVTLFSNELFIDIFPLTAAVNILLESIYYNISEIWRPLLFLIMTTIIFLGLILYISHKLFFNGWSRNQEVNIKKKKTKTIIPEIKSQSIILNIVISEMKQAIRNQQVLAGSIMFFGGYLLLFFLIESGSILGESSYLALLVLCAAATSINVIASISPYTPIEIAVDFSLMKKRYWLAKIMPFNGKVFFWSELIKVIVPAAIISVLTIFIFMLTEGMSLLMVIGVILLFLVVLTGNTAINVSWEILTNSKYEGKMDLKLNILSLLLPLFFNILVFTPYLLYLLTDVLVNRPFLYKLSLQMNPVIAVVFTLFISLFSVMYFLRLAEKAWAEMEI